MFDRFVNSMNNAWVSTKQAVADSVEHAKTNAIKEERLADGDVQNANDTYELILSTIKFINLKVEVLQSEFIESSKHLLETMGVFSKSFDNMIQTANENKNDLDPSILSVQESVKNRLDQVKLFDRIIRNLTDQLIPQYVLHNFEPVRSRLLQLKDTKDNLHKLCHDIEQVNKQLNAPVTKPIMEKMQKPQQRLASMTKEVETLKPEYIKTVHEIYEEFNEAKKKAYTALEFYHLQFFAAIEKYIINPAAKPALPPFTDYSDLTNILPDYLQLISSEQEEE